MACSTSVVPCALAPTFSRATPATRANPSSLELRAPTLPKSTSFLGGKLAQPAQGAKVLRSRPASIARAQAVSTSAPEVAGDVAGTEGTVTKGDSDDDPKWLELHGKNNWEGLLPVKGKDGKPGKFDDDLKKTIIKYGEMAQLTYDSVDLNEWSRYRSQNRFAISKKDGNQLVHGGLFGKHLQKTSHFQYLRPEEGYKAEAYMYANEKAKVIRAIKKPKGQDIREDVWIGYIAYSETNQDLVVAWRGTLQPAEWVADAEVSLIKYDPFKHEDRPQTLKQKDVKTSEHEDATKASEPKDHQKSESLKSHFWGLAFWGAAGWGGLSAFIIAFPLYFVFKFFEAESFLGAAYTAAFSAAAALPIYKYYFEDKKSPILNSFLEEIGGVVKQVRATIGGVVKQKRDKIGGAGEADKDKEAENFKVTTFVWLYVGAAALLTGLVNRETSPDLFLIVDPLMFFFFVLLPTGRSAGNEAAECAGEGPQVHEGFYELYDPTGDKKKPLPKSGAPRHVVHETVEQLLSRYPHTRTITVTGHSLGGALAVLSAYDIVESGCNVGENGERIQVACFAFEAPRVGNPAFAESFEANHVNKLSAIRVVNKPDIVTQVPKAFFLQNVYYVLAAIFNSDFLVDKINRVEELYYEKGLPSAFQHVAPEQELVHDSRDVDYLKKMPSWWNPFDNIDSVGNYHNLEVNLHLVSGYWSETFDRDFALCNKSADVIDPRAGVAPNWFATKLTTVIPSHPSEGKPPALIEPYTEDLQSKEKADEERKAGEGPVASRTSGKCEPLVRDYFARYLENYEPPKNWFQKAWDLIVGDLAGKSPEQKK